MNIERDIGLAAALLTTISFVPQVVRSWRTRDTRSISLPMYSVFTLGVGLWLIYGIMLHDLPITLANGVTLLLAGIVLILKLRHG
ncbi:MAG TPA: SemiSWEET transporter [Gammaproteobacteria bacterium]|nr:SemiSWEET transporter [Gammaproteobacteria bacterium]